jgi:hypothetical protein
MFELESGRPVIDFLVIPEAHQMHSRRRGRRRHLAIH